MSFALLLLLSQFPNSPSLFGGTRDGGSSEAYFEFAPASQTGMTSPCDCSTPTGTKGEALTFTRAGSATCIKSNRFSGVSNGDMVTCSTNQPRVVPLGDGSAALGIQLEPARANALLRSQKLDNAAWTNSTGGAAAPTTTADFGVSLDGTQTAERLQFPAATSAQFTMRSQINVGAAGTYSAYCWVKGNGESGAVQMFFNACVSCAYNPNTWTMCSVTNQAIGGASTFYIGSDPLDCSLGNQPAKDVLITKCQVEVGKDVSSYVETEGSPVARATESASFSASIAAAVATAGSAAVSVFTTPTVGMSLINFRNAASDGRAMYLTGVFPNVSLFDGTNDPQLDTGTLSQTVVKRFATDWSGSTSHTYNVTDGTSTAGSFTGSFTTDTLGIGTASWATELNGIIGRVCIHTSTTRCR